MTQEQFLKQNHDLRRTDNPNDVVFTPAGLAKRCIDLIPFSPGDKVLDPARGGGAFYDNYPEFVKKDWCEFDEGKDFMIWTEPVDWIVTNPPYSALNRWIEKACSVSRKGIGYLIHLHSITPKRLQIINDLDFGLTDIYVCKVMDWFGMSAFIVLQRGYGNIIKYNREVWR